jgi:hypothetical protein
MNVSWRHMLASAGMAVLAAGAFTAIGVSAAAGNPLETATTLASGGGSSSGVGSAAGGAFYNAASRAGVQE